MLCMTLVAAFAAPAQTRFIVPYAPGGAGGSIAGDYVAKSASDGKTLFVGSNGQLVVNTALYAKIPYNPEKDFVPVSGFGKAPLPLVVRNDLPAKTAAELASYAKAAPATLRMGSAGNGNITHLAGEYVSGMLGGHIDLMYDALPSCMQQACSGRIRPLAILNNKRIAQLPDVPTMRELGFPDAEASAWFGLVAPARTNPEVVRSRA